MIRRPEPEQTFHEYSRQVPVSADDEVWLAVLVDHLGAGLQPQPAEVFAHEAVGDQARAARFDHCNRKRSFCQRSRKPRTFAENEMFVQG